MNKNKYTLGWINCLKEKIHVKVLLSHVWLFTRPWTVAHQAPLSIKFFRQEYWSGLPFPSPGDLPDRGIEPGSPTLLVDSLPFEPSIQFSSVVQSCPALGDCSTPGLSVHHQLPELIQTHVHQSVMSSNHLNLYHRLLLLPSIFPTVRVFSNESVLCIKWPKYWSFSFSISPSNEYSGLISIRMDWLDLPAVQGTLKSLLQHHSSTASILWCSAFLIV